MDVSGPDSLTSWVTAALCCFINTVLLGLSRTSGILFVASLSTFTLSREKAVLPYTLSIFIQNLSSPLVIFLGRRFGVRTITTIGCILGAVGVGTCYFAENITAIIVLWGLIVGIGFSVATAVLPEFINQHFDFHITTASLMLPSGAALGSFLLPPIVDLLLNVYGFSGSFLLLCGFVLNCIPASLLLKKPIFEENDSKFNYSDKTERKSIASEVRVRFYAAGDISDTSDSSSGDEYPKHVPRIEIEEASNRSLLLTYEEKIEQLSTQTLFSDYLVRLSCADALNVDEIIENSKGRRKIDRNLLETEVLSLYSIDAEQDQKATKDNFFEKRIRFASVQYQKPITPGKFNQKITISSESVVSDTGKTFYEKTCNKNYDYQPDSSKHNTKPDAPLISVTHHDLTENNEQLYVDNNDIYLRCPYNKSPGDCKDIHGRTKSPSTSTRHSSKCSEISEKERFKVRHKMLCIFPLKNGENENRTFSDILRIVSDPVIMLICFSHAVSNFTLICILTVVVDFMQDLSIHTSNGKYVIMTLSAAELIGLWALRWIKEHCYMTTVSFVCVCFACQGAVTSAIVWSSGFPSLMILTSLYGAIEAGLIVAFPILMEHYIDDDKINIVVQSSKIVTGLLCLAISPLIGYFRDHIGTYDYIFYGLSIISAISCFAWMLVQCILRSRRQH